MAKIALFTFNMLGLILILNEKIDQSIIVSMQVGGKGGESGESTLCA